MIRKSLGFLLIGFIFVLVGDGQTPAPAPKGEARSCSFFFEGDGSYLGVQTEEITKDNFAKYGLREVRGVAVEKVIEGSPAEKAGIQNGDVIIRFNNEEVTSVRKLSRLMGEVAADHQAKVTVLRNGSEREITATLSKRPSPKFDEGSFSMNAPQVPFPQGDFPSIPKIDPLPRIEMQPPG